MADREDLYGSDSLSIWKIEKRLLRCARIGLLLQVGEQLVVDLFLPADHFMTVKLDGKMSPPEPHLLGMNRMMEQPENPLCEPRHISGLDQKAIHPVANDVRRPVHPGPDHGDPAGQGLQIDTG